MAYQRRNFALVVVGLLLCSMIINVHSAPVIQDAQYNSESKAIDINLQYGGGCKEHQFVLQIGACREIYPVQYDAQLIDLTVNDYCEAFISRKVSISLQAAGLDSSYYSGATINIQGAANTKASIILPS